MRRALFRRRRRYRDLFEPDNGVGSEVSTDVAHALAKCFIRSGELMNLRREWLVREGSTVALPEQDADLLDVAQPVLVINEDLMAVLDLLTTQGGIYDARDVDNAGVFGEEIALAR